MRAMNSVDEDSGILESRVLIIMTGGTICMDYAKDVGYVPVSIIYEYFQALVMTWNNNVIKAD